MRWSGFPPYTPQANFLLDTRQQFHELVWKSKRYTQSYTWGCWRVIVSCGLLWRKTWKELIKIGIKIITYDVVSTSLKANLHECRAKLQRRPLLSPHILYPIYTPTLITCFPVIANNVGRSDGLSECSSNETKNWQHQRICVYNFLSANLQATHFTEIGYKQYAFGTRYNPWRNTTAWKENVCPVWKIFR